jgi:anti-anti-sigma regulatory factor
MLRIEQTGEDDDKVSMKLEGRVVAQWVSLLEEECLRVLQARKRLILDFAGVSFIDPDGIAILEKVRNERAQIVNACPFVSELLRLKGTP